MIIHILDSNLKKLDILRKYTFSQYTEKARDIGTFRVLAQYVDENKYLLNPNNQYYVLFDDTVFGKIEKANEDSDGEYDNTIELTGRLAPVIFKKRVIDGTIKFKGYSIYYIQAILNKCITTEDPQNPRRINMNTHFDNEDTIQNHYSNIERQVTGGYAWDEIYDVLEQDSLSLKLYPVVQTLTMNRGYETNIVEWDLYISTGVDRRKGNTKGNEPVIFSRSLSNISRTNYTINTENYCNIAYIAGEGEDEDRKWYSTIINQDANLPTSETGWNRSELWIDARDIQSEDEDGNKLSDEEYEQAISERANEKFSENRMSESYEATITNANNQYTYGVDYNKGDWVTVVDDELKISIDVQITEVTKSVEGDREIVDIGFMYGAIKRRDSENSEYVSGKLEQVANDIRYIENKINLGQKVLWQGAYYMNESQTINLSEKISKQKNGIVLVFSSYDPSTHTAHDYDYFEAFVPKRVVELSPGKGHQFFYNHVTGSFAYGKYLYIYDSEIQGNADNVSVGTGKSGITYMNNRGVLRYVLGV